MKEVKGTSLKYIVAFDDLPERELLKPCILYCGPNGFCLIMGTPSEIENP